MSPQDFGDSPSSDKENTLPRPRTLASAVSHSEASPSRQLNTTPRPSILGSSRLANRISNRPLETLNPAAGNLNNTKHLQQSPSFIQSSNLHIDNSLGETSGLHCYSADDWKGQENASDDGPGASSNEAERGDSITPLNQIMHEEAAQIGDADDIGEDDCQ
jgi:hypothetical protein